MPIYILFLSFNKYLFLRKSQEHQHAGGEDDGRGRVGGGTGGSNGGAGGLGGNSASMK